MKTNRIVEALLAEEGSYTVSSRNLGRVRTFVVPKDAYEKLKHSELYQIVKYGRNTPDGEHVEFEIDGRSSQGQKVSWALEKMGLQRKAV